MENKILLLIVCMVLFLSIVWLSSYSVGDIDKESTVNTTGTTKEIVQTTTESVKVTYPTESVEDNLIKSINLSAEDTDILLRIGMCEAGGEDIECIASVMCVVLNRTRSDSFPNSVHDVIYQGGQFTPVQTGWIDTVEPSNKCYEALNMVLNGWDKSQNALYFESCSGESWHSRNLEYLYSYGNMKFYK